MWSGCSSRSVISMKKYFFIITACLFQAVCFAQDDTLYQRDSVIELETDCSEDFFLNIERIKDPSRISLVARNGKTYTMPSFFKAFNVGGFSESGLDDLDGDGKKELVISNFTGGAHCCDEIYIFRNIVANRYQYVAKTFAGHVCFLRDKKLRFSFYEGFGYFFTCYACSYTDTTDVAPIPVSSIELQYLKGKLVVIPGDASLKSMIRDNLGKLSEQPYEKVDDISQDNGLRKEFALNLAVYYYSFGRNLVETRNLFNKYYRFPDAKTVWAEFNKLLANVKKTNHF
jgi:hypothetical protein